MSGKCIWLTMGLVLCLGFLLGLTVLLFQESDTSDPENSQQPSSTNGHREETFDTKFAPKLDRNNSSRLIESKRKLNINMKALEGDEALESHTEPSLIPPQPLSIPSTIRTNTISKNPSIPISKSLPKQNQVDRTPWHGVSNPIYEQNPERNPFQIISTTETQEIHHGVNWDQISPNPDDNYGGEEYEDVIGDEVEEDETGTSDPWDSLDFNEVLDLVSQFYRSGGLNTSNLQHEFLRVVNDTFMSRVNGTGILSQLNQMYDLKKQVLSPVFGHNGNDSVSTGRRNAYEGSLTAFAFMSFGIFLLNQIHNLLGGPHGSEKVEGRNFQMNGIEDMLPTRLNLLFKPPPLPGNLESSAGVKKILEEARSKTKDSTVDSTMNNMFRAMLNLLNAYTRDSGALDCIWAIYCEDLDKTSATEGLYGIAARINSIGLRLIMHQLPTELTLDALLKSLLGWDGLPCQKMFPGCQTQNLSLSAPPSLTGKVPIQPKINVS